MEKLHLHVCCEGRWHSSRDANVTPDTLSPYVWERETTKQRWSQMTYAFALTVSKEQRKWACQLWGRSEQVYSNECKLFSAHFKNENQKTFLEAHRMFLIFGPQVSYILAHPFIALSFRETAQQNAVCIPRKTNNNWGRRYFVFNLIEFFFFFSFFALPVKSESKLDAPCLCCYSHQAVYNCIQWKSPANSDTTRPTVTEFILQISAIQLHNKLKFTDHHQKNTFKKSSTLSHRSKSEWASMLCFRVSCPHL